MSEAKSKFEEALYADLVLALDKLIRKLKKEHHDLNDVYALSLWIDDQDDPRSRYANLSATTERQFRRSSPDTADKDAEHVASSPAEARWNFAHWLQSPDVRVPDPANKQLGKLQLAVARESGSWYEDSEEEAGEDEVWGKMDAIDDLFWGCFAACVKRLHESREITQRFGKPIPVILHCLEYGDQQERHTNAANPPELLNDFRLPW